MATAHQQQIKDSVVRSFSDANIPMKFHDRDLSLGKVPGSELALEWIDQIKDGKYSNLIIYGDNSRAMDMMYLACRGLLLMHVSSRIYGLRQLYRELFGGDRGWGMFPTIPVIHNFQQDGRECSLRPYEIEDMEEWLLPMLNDGGVMILRTATLSMVTRNGGWWSNTLIDTIYRESYQVNVE